MVDYSKWSDGKLDALLNDSDDDEPSRPAPAAAKGDSETRVQEAIAAVRSQPAKGEREGGQEKSESEAVAVGEEDLGDVTLSQAFRRAELLISKLGDLHPTSDEAVKTQASALRLVEHATRLVEISAVFSKNETLHDANTAHIPLLLLPHYRATLLSNCADLTLRAARLKQAVSALKEFVAVLVRMEAVPPHALQACQRILDAENEGDSAAAPQEAAQQREERLARHRRDKQLRERIEQLQAKLSKQRPKRGGEEEEGREDGGEEDEEEGARELATLRLEEALAKTLTDLPLYQQEIELLAMRERLGGGRPPAPPRGEVGVGQMGGGRGRGRGGRGGLQTVHIPRTGPTSEGVAAVQRGPGAGRVQVTGSALEKRAAMIEGVFRNPNPASMTVQEWGDVEVERMQEQTIAQAKAQKEEELREAEMTEDDKEERARLKASSWDDWKDEHPKGAGNKGDNYFKRG